MKKLGIRLGVIALVLMMTMVFIGCDNGGGGERAMTPGTFVTEARGYVDYIRVATTVDRTRIQSVRVLEHRETVGIGCFAINIMPGRITEAQSLAVDTVTSATITAEAIRAAVRASLREAGANMARFERGLDWIPHDQELNFEVVVIGSGAAGMIAAIEAQNQLYLGAGVGTVAGAAARRGVLVIEHMDAPGGNSTRCSGTGTRITPFAGIAGGTWITNNGVTIPNDVAALEERRAEQVARALRTGRGKNDVPMVEFMTRASYTANPNWLRAQGIEFPVTNGMFGLMMRLFNRFELQGGTLLTRVRGEDLIMDGNAVIGVKARDLLNGGEITINATAVVIATGGFGGDVEYMIPKYDPNLAGFVTTNTPGADGSGIYIAQRAGAAVRHMEYIQIHPTVHQVSSTMFTEGIRNLTGGILLNEQGFRFVDERNVRPHVAAGIMAQTNSHAFVLYNIAHHGNAVIRGYYEMGLTRPFDTLEALAAWAGLPYPQTGTTVMEWAALTQSNNVEEIYCELTNRPIPADYPAARSLATGPWLGQWVAPGIHYTMGGIWTNVYTQVIRETGTSFVNQVVYNGQVIHPDGSTTVETVSDYVISGTPALINGLFAAGETVGGTHGAMRFGANSALEIQTFGRVAGLNAARFVLNQGPILFDAP